MAPSPYRNSPTLAVPPPAGTPDVNVVAERWARHRPTLVSYAQVLAGTGGRLALQVIYFFVLANTLSLREMGVFASASAAGILVGCLAGLGFQSLAFRAAAGRTSSLGGYLAIYYGCFAGSLPLSLVAAAPLYVFVFQDAIGLPGYLAIILVEVALWRLIELMVQVNNGLGRYAAAAAIIMISSALRALAAVAFLLAGGGSADIWAFYYLVGNAISAAVILGVFHPRVRLRWRRALFVGRLRDALLSAFAYFAFLAQSEVDKIIIIWLAGERAAGIYAIAMRLIDLTAVPLRPIFVLYSRKLVGAVATRRSSLVESLRIEGVVALVSTAGLGALLLVLALWPRLLGTNVAASTELLGVIVAVPAIRNLLEFHAELFLAYGRMGVRAVVAGILVVIKATALAVLLTALPAADGWGFWLNAVYGLLYVVSFAVLYGLLGRKAST